MVRATKASWFLLLLAGLSAEGSQAFTGGSAFRSSPVILSATTAWDETEVKAKPRTGWAQQVLDFCLKTPIWKYVLVPQARSTMVKTAESNGIPWIAAKEWIVSNTQREGIPSIIETPSYYQNSFHAYEEGNLCWDAAMEVEIASCSVGARNFPQYGSQGEEFFRGSFEKGLFDAGASVPKGARILDMGCGTGMSTRRLAKSFPQASLIQGIDLSPYFVSVGKQLLRLEPKSFEEGGDWVSTVENDDRIEYAVGDAANSGLPAESFDVVNLSFVLHELPPEAAQAMVDEAMRLLKPGGQLWVCEMDFESPAYAQQRANALLFALIRSTEPYLDVYAESMPSLFSYIRSHSSSGKVIPATGRHYALVANKGSNAASKEEGKGEWIDTRFNDDGTYRVEDTHLQVWETKE